MISAPLAPGTLLHNRYRIVGAAGGRSGRTYLARDEVRSETLCLLKEFALPSSEPQALEVWQNRFQKAVASIYKLQHPQLPRYQVMFIEGDRGYWVREYIEGKDYGTLLRERVTAGQSFSETDVLQLLEQVIPVLDYLHQQGIIHSNVSLESLIRRDQDHLPVLINYGLVKELVAQLQTAQTLPIDFKRSQVDSSCDRTALASLAVSLLAGLEENRGQIAQRVAADPAFTQLLSPKYFQPELQSQPNFSDAIPGQSRVRSARSQRSTHPSRLPPVAPAVRSRSIAKNDAISSVALVISLILLVAAATLRLAAPSRPSLEPPSSATAPLPKPTPLTEKPVPSPSAPLPVPTPPPPPQGVGGDEPTKLQSFHAAAPEPLRDRRRQLGIDFPFFTRLVDEAFYVKYPELKQRKLGQGAEQEKYRSEWNAIALALMDKLQQITPEMRGKLGTYQRSNYDQWLKAIGEPNQRKLAESTDRRFLELFPDQQGKPQNPHTYGQIWYAVAHEQSQHKEFQP